MKWGDEGLALLAAIGEWDGTLESSIPLRHRFQELRARAEHPYRAGGKSATHTSDPDPLDALSRLDYAYRRADARRLLADALRNSAHPVVFGPFFGDPALCPWPWDDPLTMSDDEALRWLPIVSKCGSVDDPKIEQLVKVLFQARPRSVWVPASQAFARLVRRSDKWKRAATDQWARAFPDGLPVRWAQSGLHGPREAGPESSPHERRHALHLICASLGRRALPSTSFAGFDAERLMTMPLPADRADASLVVLSLAELPPADVYRPSLRRMIGGMTPSVQGGSVRTLYDAIRIFDPNARDALAKLDAILQTPSWRNPDLGPAERFDSLWQWLQTASWYAAGGRPDAVAAMSRVAPEAHAALQLRTGGGLPPDVADEVLAIVVRLPVVFDPLISSTQVPTHFALRLAELLLLIGRPSVRAIPWRALFLRACKNQLADSAPNGSVGEVARAEVTLALAQRNFAPEALLHDVELRPSELVRIAGSADGRVATQVAIQLERWLRSPDLVAAFSAGAAEERAESSRDPEYNRGYHKRSQVRLLWRVLQANPPPRTFVELHRMLRGVDTPLHASAKAVIDFDKRRASAESGGETAGDQGTADAAASVVERAADVLDAKLDGDIRILLQTIAGDLRRMVDLRHSEKPSDTVEWQSGLERLLFGEGNHGGLESLMRWVGTPVDDLRPRWAELKNALLHVEREGVKVTHEQCEQLARTLAGVHSAIGGLASPDRAVVSAALERAEHCLTDAQAAAAEADEINARVRKMIARNSYDDEQELVALAESGDELRYLDAEEVTRLSRYLLDHQRFMATTRLRWRVGPHAHVHTVWTYLFPVLVGVVAGPFLVLDIGIDWMRLSGSRWPYWLTVLSGLGWSALLLTANLSHSLGMRQHASRLERFRLIARRVLTVILPAWIVAMCASIAVLATVGWASDRDGLEVVTRLFADCRSSAWQRCSMDVRSIAAIVLLWSSLSLFLGLFLGLLLQGRSFTARH